MDCMESAARILAALAEANGGEIRVKKEAADSFGPPRTLDVSQEGDEIVVKVG